MKKIGIVGAFALFAIPALVFADHAPVQTPEHACEITKNISLGARGADVECLQNHLIEAGYLDGMLPKGYFGRATKKAVMEWQTAAGIPATGFFGVRSREEIHGKAHAMSDMSAPTSTSAHMDHPKLDVASWPAVPSVTISTQKDAMSGYNLNIVTSNFRFAPEHASSAVIPGEGHAHLMVDGKKIARVYGAWFHIPAEAVAAKGNHEVMVTLNANDHSDLAHNGGVILATTSIMTN